MNFREARSEYLRLRHAYRSGQLPPDQYQKQINALTVHSKGQIWVIGIKSGKWYRREGKNWIEDVPEIEDEAPTVGRQNKAGKKRNPVKEKFSAIYVRKPNETSQQKSYRQLTLGFSIIFLLLLAIMVTAGLMLKGIIKMPAAIGSVLGVETTGEADSGIGAADAFETYTSLSGYLGASAISVDTGEGKISGLLYSSRIRGKWLLRDDSDETLVFDKNGNLRLFSAASNYDYAGEYSFTDDHTIIMNTMAGSLKAEIWIDSGVLTLVIENNPLVYDRLE